MGKIKTLIKYFRGVGETHREVKAENLGRQRVPQQVNLLGADRYLGASQVRKRGGKKMWKMAADTGMRCVAQRRAADAGEWRVYVTFRWTAFRASRRGGKRLLQRGVTT